MDRIGLQTLRAEMLADSGMMQEAYAKAAQRLARAEEVAYEGCGHQLCRFYNAFEHAGLRLAKAFENHIDNEEGWHPALLNRLYLEIEGLRPALIPRDLKNALNELRGFRHVFVHAYDLALDPGKLQPLVEYAGEVAGRFPALIESFVSAVEKRLP
jgi:hypothetical protein